MVPDPASARRRLLFLSQVLPYPPDGGVRIRAYHVLRLLAAEYDVTALCFYRTGSQARPWEGRPEADELRERARGAVEQAGAHAVEAFRIPQEYHKTRLLWDHLRSVASRRAYTFYVFESGEFRRRLEQVLSEETFDLIYVGSLVLSAYLPDVLGRGVPVVCDHHNVESTLLRSRAERAGGTARGRYLRYQASLVEREEREWCGRVDLNFTVSPSDRDLIVQRAPRARITVVPNGVDTATFRPVYSGGSGLIFVGGYTWFPNRDGMEHFAARVLTRLRERIGSVPVRWVGRAPADVIERFGSEFGIEMTGYVEDIRPYVEKAGCYIVPLRVGGGTRLKILDAWAMGKAVVSTSKGCEGLDARDGENILIRDADEAFASAVAQVLGDEELRRRLGHAARRTAEEVYDWESVGRTMLGALDELEVRTVAT